MEPVKGGPAVGSAEDTGTAAGHHTTLSARERAELEALRAEVARLHEHLERPRHRSSWRTPVASLLIVLGCILAPLSVIAVWTANQVSDTDRYVENVTPLIHEPSIQRALTDDITAAVTKAINVPGRTSQVVALLNQKNLTRVGTLVQGLSGPIASAVQGFVHGQVAKIDASPQTARLWVQVNRTAHQELVKALSGRGGGAIGVSNGEVTLDLTPFVTVVKQDLASRGLPLVDKVPIPRVTLPLFPSRDLERAQTAYRLVNNLKIALPVVALLLLALGVYIARGHRRALIAAGLGLAAAMVVLGAALLIIRGAYLNAIPPGVLSSDAAAAAFDILVRFIRSGLRTLLAAGLAIAAGAFLTGPSVTAVRIRRAFSAAFGCIRRGGETYGITTGPAGRWTYAHRAALRIGAVALAAIVFVFWGRPTAMVVVLIAVPLLAVLGLIELIGRPPPSPAP
jgi:hypothetical protein